MKHQLILLLALTSLLLFANASDRLRPQRPLNSSEANRPDHSNSTNHTLSNSTNRSPRPEDYQGRPHLEGLPRVPKGDSNNSSNSRDHQAAHGDNINSTMNKNHTAPHHANETTDSDASRLLAQTNSSQKFDSEDKKKNMNASRVAHPHEKSHNASYFSNKTHFFGDDRNRSIAKNHTTPNSVNETIPSDAPRLAENNASHNVSHTAYGNSQKKHMNVSKGAYPHEKSPSAPHFANMTHAHDGDHDSSMNQNHTVAANETSNSDGFRLPSGAEEGAMKP